MPMLTLEHECFLSLPSYLLPLKSVLACSPGFGLLASASASVLSQLETATSLSPLTSLSLRCIQGAQSSS